MDEKRSSPSTSKAGEGCGPGCVSSPSRLAPKGPMAMRTSGIGASSTGPKAQGLGFVTLHSVFQKTLN